MAGSDVAEILAIDVGGGCRVSGGTAGLTSTSLVNDFLGVLLGFLGGVLDELSEAKV